MDETKVIKSLTNIPKLQNSSTQINQMEKIRVGNRSVKRSLFRQTTSQKSIKLNSSFKHTFYKGAKESRKSKISQKHEQCCQVSTVDTTQNYGLFCLKSSLNDLDERCTDPQGVYYLAKSHSRLLQTSRKIQSSSKIRRPAGKLQRKANSQSKQKKNIPQQYHCQYSKMEAESSYAEKLKTIERLKKQKGMARSLYFQNIEAIKKNQELMSRQQKQANLQIQMYKNILSKMTEDWHRSINNRKRPHQRIQNFKEIKKSDQEETSEGESERQGKKQRLSNLKQIQ